MDAISKLPVKLRMPLILKDIEGFSYQEISETLKCEMGTVKSRIFRGREKLKEILQPLGKRVDAMKKDLQNKELLSAYLDDELTQSEKAGVEKLLASSLEMQKNLEDLKKS